MNDPMLPLPGLSPASGKPVVVKFDGGLLSSDGGVLALREVEQRLRLADRLAACIVDPRDPDQVCCFRRRGAICAGDPRFRDRFQEGVDPGAGLARAPRKDWLLVRKRACM